MEKVSGSGVKPATRFGFGFSWADEVEREELEQQAVVQQQQAPAEAKKERKATARADPFGAARPREVVLAEKGVDWRTRDSEIDAAGKVAILAARAPAAASIRGRTVPPPARAPVWTPGPRRRGAEPTPQAKGAPPGSRNAWGGRHRKCAGEVPPPALGGNQRRRVFGEINDGEGSFDSRGIEKVGNKASEAAVADGGCSAAAASATATTTEDQSTASQKRKRKKRGGRKGRSKKTENQHPLLI